MKRLSLISAMCLVGAAAQAQLIDTFSGGDLSAYSDVRILNNGNHDPVNTYNWITSDGTLRLETTQYTGIEQFALVRTDFALGVGLELMAEYAAAYTGPQDIGIYVGAGVPTQDVRQDYVNVYVRNNGQIFSRGFNGTTEFGLAGGATPGNIDALFIARTTMDTFELGYYDAGIRNVLTTRTIENGNAAGIGDAIGFYADVRGAGIVGSLDTLAIVPEPSAFAFLGLGALMALARWRRKS